MMIVKKFLSTTRLQTDLCRKDRWVRELFDRNPYVWVWMDPPIKRYPEVWSHFGTWFWATTQKTYRNPFMNDLYWIHEVAHYDSLVYDPSMRGPDWGRMFIASERYASLVSETLAHLHVKGLRKKVFKKHEIWVDRFLRDRTLTAIHPRALDLHLTEARREASFDPRPDDPFERQIAGYLGQNHQWCALWSEPAWVPSERKTMPVFRAVLEHIHSKPSERNHVKWLMANGGATTGVPFHDLAKAFYPIFQATSAKYGNHLLTR